jgi:sec-independent protein translocase protein TatA
LPGWIGLPELLILLVVVLLFFGPKRLPEMGRSLGRGMREFKESVTGNNDHDDDDDPVAALPVGTQQPAPVVRETAAQEAAAGESATAPAAREHDNS